MPSWRVVLIRKKAERVGVVEAASAEDAMRKAIEVLRITDPERQRRLAAQRIETT